MKSVKAGYTLVQRSNKIRFSEIGIKSILSSALEKRFQIVHPTLSQKAFIPAILSGADLFIRDLTGSGKTFGLALSAVAYPRFASVRKAKVEIADAAEKLHQREVIYDENAIHDHEFTQESDEKKPMDVMQLSGIKEKKRLQDRYIHTVIIVPTRDLAIQVFDWIKSISGININAEDMAYLVQCIISGPEEQSQRDLLQKYTPRIVVGTPNRLLSLYNSKDLNLSRVKLLIIDEADRIVDAVSSHAPVKKRFNSKVHKLDGETLIEQLFEGRKRKGNESKIQVVACSASINATIRNKFKRNGWVLDPIQVDTTGDLTLPNTLEHHAFVVQSDGLYSFDWSTPEPEKTMETDIKEAPSYSSEEQEISQGLQLTTLPDDDPMIIESIRYLIDLGNFSSGFIFAHSSVSIRKLVTNLQSKGIDARRFIDIRNYQQQSQSLDVDPQLNLPRWLVLTEHEARGLDLPNASAVFILGPSSSPQSYLHMAGRVGRAGKIGTVITVLGGPIYERKFKGMASLLKISPSQNKIA